MTLPELRAVGDDGVPKRRGRPAGEGFDEWSTTGFEIEETRFYTKSTDADGNFFDFRAKVPTYLITWANRVVQSKHYTPLRNYQDLIRHALVKELHRLVRQLDDPAFLMHVTDEMRQCDEQQDRDEMMRKEGTVASHAETLDYATRIEDVYGLDRAIMRLEDTILTIREPYRAQLTALGKQYRPELKRLRDKLAKELDAD